MIRWMPDRTRTLELVRTIWEGKRLNTRQADQNARTHVAKIWISIYRSLMFQIF